MVELGGAMWSHQDVIVVKDNVEPLYEEVELSEEVEQNEA